MHRTLLFAVAALSLKSMTPAAPSPEAAKANNALSFDLLEQIAKGEDNLVYSPLSIWTALAMTSAGAEGETLREMRSTLHLPEDDAAAHKLAGDWAKALTGAKDVELNVANRLWGAKGLPFIDGFLKLTQEHYRAGLETLDFKGEPEKARGRINSWVEGETKDRIKNLLHEGDITPLTRLVLTNAVYFKGKWQRQFDPNATRDGEFTLSSGDKAMVKMMSVKVAAPYMEDDRLQAVRLGYVGGMASMVVVLPRKADALKSGGFLDAGGFARVGERLKAAGDVAVLLPRFESSARVSLPGTLARLGMKRAFTESAEFGRLCAEPLMISDVIHQAWVKVGEEGTEAAAATAVTMRAGSAAPQDKPRLFLADHPFLYFIVDDRNGGVLFAGRVMDPRK